nr:EAL domain-containing protein [Thermus albus]
MPSHGHAILPLKVGERILGILNLYLEPGARVTEEGRAQLETAAGLLALAVLKERAERAARILHRATLLSLEAQDEAEYLKRLCALVVEEGYVLAWVGEALPYGRVRPLERDGAVGYLEGLLVRHDETPEGQGPTGRAIRLGEPQVVRDVGQDPNYGPWRLRAQSFGFASSAAFPLRIGERVFGALNIYASEPDAFDQEEVAILRDLASLAGKNLERLRSQAQAHLLVQLVEQVPESVFITDLEGHITYANPALFAQTGYEPGEVLGQTPRLFKSGLHPEAFYRHLWDTLEKGQVFRSVFFNRRKDGRLLVEDKILTPLPNPRGQLVAYASTGRNVTQEWILHGMQRALIRMLERFLQEGMGRSLFQYLLDEVLMVIPGAEAGSLLLRNQDGKFSCVALSGHDPALREVAFASQEVYALRAPASIGRVSGEELREFVQSLASETASLLVEKGRLAEIKETLYARLEVNGEAKGVLYLDAFHGYFPEETMEAFRFLAHWLEMVFSWERAQVQARYLRYHDPLTGLPNRALLEEEWRGEGEVFSLALAALDKFGDVNRRYGRAEGDALLVAAVRAWQGLLPRGGRLYRLGDDEFLFILPWGPEQVFGFYQELNRVFQASLPGPLAKEARGVSLGVAVYPEDGRELGELLRRADLALRQAKKGRGIAYFNPELETAYLERMDRMAALEEALREERLVLFGQPIVDLSTLEPVAIEVLVRWPREDGFWPAGAFIPLAEETGLIRELDLYVLRLVGRLPNKHVWHVNLSPKTLGDPRLLEVASRLQGKGVRFEITEYALAQGVEGILQSLKEMGFALVLDDFGQGYASLHTLVHHPFDMVKIDRVFVAGLGKDPKAHAVVRSSLGLAHELRLSLVAEGVETEEQREWLLRLGCRYAQGYFFGMPQAINGA